jgi:predicted RNA-binding protein associated with RNAse of E/G family
MMASGITIIKQNHHGEKVWSYPGEVAARGETWVCITAPFSGTADRDLGYVVFRRSDTFYEWHYSDRWYNVFKIFDSDGRLKGWYCNVTRPALITEDTIRADDIALDVFVYPNREILVLDEDEFAALNLPPDEQRAAWEAVETIRRLVAAGESPFDESI